MKVQVWIGFRASPWRWKVLLLKMRKDRGGYWQPVTGSVEKGETLAQGALREAEEETGLRFSGKPIALRESFRFASQWGGICEEHGFFLSVKWEGSDMTPHVTLDPKEHTDYEWVTPSRASQRLGFASNRKMLKACMARLARVRRVKNKRLQKRKKRQQGA